MVKINFSLFVQSYSVFRIASLKLERCAFVASDVFDVAAAAAVFEFCRFVLCTESKPFGFLKICKKLQCLPFGHIFFNDKPIFM